MPRISLVPQPSLSGPFGPEFTAVLLICATACPGDGDPVTGPTSEASNDGEGLWPIDMSTGALIGEPKPLGSYGMLSSPMLDWRPDDSFYIGRVMYYGAKDQKFETVTMTLDSSYDIKGSVALPTYGFNSWYDWYEASWVRTDDGYVLVATRFPWHSALNTEDSRNMRVQVWNVGLDGKIRESTLLPDLRAHTPRIAIKEGRVAITYAHMLEPYESLDSRRLVFASCPP